MKIKWILFITLALFVVSSFGIADEPETPKPLLKKGDVVRFIKTFPQMEKDFKQFGAQYEAQSGNVTIPEAMKASQDFMNILKKHGWDENFFQKLSVIMMGYSAIEYGKQATKSQAEFEKSLKEIESNPNIPPAMKEQLKQQLKSAYGIMKTQGTELQKRIHPADLNLIRPQVQKLKETIDKSGND
jgi:hypothetical protein